MRSGRKSSIGESNRKRVTSRSWIVAVIVAVGMTSLIAIGSSHWRVRAATNYYVSLTGSDSNIGTISSPFQTMRKAVQMASSGDTILVFDGIYTNPNNWVTIDKDVTIQGFSQLAIFNKGTTPAIPCFTIAQGHTVTIRNIIFNSGATVYEAAPQAVHIQILSGATVTVDDVFIRNGRPQSSTGQTTRGGSIYNEGTLTFINGIFENCVADEGGGIYNAGTLTVGNTIFNNGISFNLLQSDKGAGIYNTGTATISNSTFQENLAMIDGGGIYNGAGRSM